MSLRRDLRFFDVFCLGVNSIVGSGIYLFPGILATKMGPASIVVFPLIGLLLIPVALSFAWMSQDYDTSGGSFLYARDAFGTQIGYVVGWTAWMTSLVSTAAVSNAISSYLAHFAPSFNTWAIEKLMSVGVLILLGVLNYRGVKLAAWTGNFFTIAKLIPLFLFLAVGLPSISPTNFIPFAPLGWRALGSSLLLSFFACQGFEHVPVPSGEAEFPAKDIPRATVWSLAGSTVLYAIIQSTAVGVYPNLAGSTRPLAQAAMQLSPLLAMIIAGGAAISTLGYTTGTALAGPRYLFALGTSPLFPAKVSAVHRRFGTPHVAIVIHTLICASLAGFLNFKKLVDFANIVVCFQYFITCAAIFKQRRDTTRTIVSVVGMATILFLASQTSLSEVVAILIVIAIGLLPPLIIKLKATHRD